jgi:hypothetical protein
MADEVKVLIETNNGAEEFYHSKNKTERLSIPFLKKILEKSGTKYADEEVKLMVDYFYTMAQIEIELQSQENEKLKNQNNDNNEKSYSLYPCEYRRAS